MIFFNAASHGYCDDAIMTGIDGNIMRQRVLIVITNTSTG
jgi:hypothetical protein